LFIAALAAASVSLACGDDSVVAATGSGGAAGGSSGSAGASSSAGGMAASGSGAGGTAASGGSSAGGAAASGGAGGSGMGGAGGAWPQALALTDRALLTRYYMDEAASGTAPTELIDHAPNPENLTLTYEGEMSFDEVDGNRALSWAAFEQSSRASMPVAGSKIVQLQATKTATIEVVLEMSQVSSSHTRLSHIGESTDAGQFTLSSSAITRAQLYVNGWNRIGLWEVDFQSLGRMVLHAVLDTAQADAEDRQRLYINGAPAVRVGGSLAVQDLVIDVGTTTHYVIGNREIGSRSGLGKIYYAALYTDALTDAEIVNNAATLLFDDDAPPP
jgi:hypothetical protein